MRARMPSGVFRPLLVATLAGGLSAGCAVDEASEEELLGPSQTGVSVQLTALPDTVKADGVSRTVVELRVRDSSGEPLRGLAVLFHLDAGDGEMRQDPGFTYVGPAQDGLVMASDDSGVARVVYVAGIAAGTTVTISARPYGIDGIRFFTRTVEMLQR